MPTRTQAEVIEDAVEEICSALNPGWTTDPNMQGTPERVARMLTTEVCAGLFTERPKITTFPNDKELDEVYVVGPITVRSMCSHHLVPVFGSAWVGVLPYQKLLGLSKFTRLVQWHAARPTLQEQLVADIADDLSELIQPLGIAVRIKAEHMCMTWRGVKDHETVMVTNIMRGRFRESHRLRDEFLKEVG